MILGAPSSSESRELMENREGDWLVGTSGRCGKRTLVCVRVHVPGDLEVRVGVRGRAGDRVLNFPSRGPGKMWFLVSLPCLFWGNHDAGAGVGVSSRSAELTEVWGVTGSMEMTQFLSRTVAHVLCDWMKILAFRIIRSNSRGQQRPHQLGHSWIQCPQPTLGLSWSRDNSIDRRTRDCELAPSPQGRVDQVHLGPLGFGDLSEICFRLLVTQILTFLAPGPEAVRKGPRPGAVGVQLGRGGDLVWCSFGLWCTLHQGCRCWGPCRELMAPTPESRQGTSVSIFVTSFC